MPWQLLELPSLAIGLLHQRVREARPADTVVEYHGCLDWAEHLLAVTDGALSPDDYTDIADNGLHHGLGDWIFAGSLYGDPTWRTAELHRYAESARVDIDRAVRMRPHVDGFIALAAKKILATDPQVVGFTTTFMQNVPSLALAKRLKHLRPDLLVVMGGANCDGPMGHALHRNHPFVDYAVRGEGEIVLPRLLDRIEAGTGVHDLPGVCWWHDGESVANEQAHTTVPPAMIPVPDFDSWQAQLSASPVREYVEPKLVLEGARGCWWGEKHQCTFCGLNGSFITFRSKSPEQLWHEIQTLMRRHRLLDLIMVDNILDMRYFHGLLPRLAASEWDLRIHYEVKSNLREDQVRQLAEARVAHVQPGIESLSSHALNLMDKGVSGTANVRLLRDCEDHQLTVSWNYLYGFPGECDDNYLAIIAQIPALVHLQPPGSATRIALERFSPYFEQPALGFPERTPAKLYDHVYDLPTAELMDLAYVFDTPPRGIGEEVERWLREAIETWGLAYPGSTLVAREGDDETLVVEDRRRGWPGTTHVLRDWQRAAYELLRRGCSADALGRKLAEDGWPVGAAQRDAWLAHCRAEGLVFFDAGTFVALATRHAAARAFPPAMEATR
ncbi:RiPP maturation radical SAM C-methyltransferase [Phytohabitans rumicis]|uniref:RiPP maturation radical SAM C-methyltransferase n=1 Tax=Phytohabitans rumicis TaxID=1076125 RepID=UPI0031E73EF6